MNINQVISILSRSGFKVKEEKSMLNACFFNFFCIIYFMILVNRDMKRRDLIKALMGGMVLATPLTILASTIQNKVRVWNHDNKLRLVFDLDKHYEYQTFLLENPFRVIIDIQSANLVNQFNQMSISGTPIKSVRSAIHGLGTRMVLEMKKPVVINSFTLAGEQGGARIVFDMIPSTSGGTPYTNKNVIEKDVNQFQNSPKRDIVVVIDAGHGGKDPGAVGKTGEMEKVVVLAIAKLLKAKFDRSQGFKAHLVRDDDFFVPLRKRVEIARKHKADIFVSIHADAAPRISANGASVYALSERGATSTTARYLAKSQNSVDLLGAKSLLDLSDKDPMLAGVILDMSMNSTISSSLTLGGSVLSSLSKTTKLHIPRTEQAAFAVLKSPDIPSILIETGFISNLKDSEKLRNPMYQKKLSESIFAGIDNYFNRYPPQGTYLEWTKSNSKNMIVG